jgi:hypothetical protein
LTFQTGTAAATIEFRVSRWFSILSTVSTIGRAGASVRVSNDY